MVNSLPDVASVSPTGVSSDSLTGFSSIVGLKGLVLLYDTIDAIPITMAVTMMPIRTPFFTSSVGVKDV